MSVLALLCPKSKRMTFHCLLISINNTSPIKKNGAVTVATVIVEIFANYDNWQWLEMFVNYDIWRWLEMFANYDIW